MLFSKNLTSFSLSLRSCAHTPRGRPGLLGADTDIRDCTNSDIIHWPIYIDKSVGLYILKISLLFKHINVFCWLALFPPVVFLWSWVVVFSFKCFGNNLKYKKQISCVCVGGGVLLPVLLHFQVSGLVAACCVTVNLWAGDAREAAAGLVAWSLTLI